MPVAERDRDARKTNESMVGSNVAAHRDNAQSLADKGEEKREAYGSTGDNDERSDSD